MGFFSKLFGFSDDEQSQPEIEKDLEFSHFFGIDMKKSPNANWHFDGEEISHNGDRIRNYSISINSYEHIFSSCRAKVIGNTATNFFFKMPYNQDSLVSILYIIERDYIPNGAKTQIEAIHKFRGKYEPENQYESVDWLVGNVQIRFDRDVYTGDIEIGVWTNFYNEELDVKDEEVEEKVEDTEIINEETQESIYSDFFGVDMLKSPASDWQLKDVIYDVHRQMTFEKDIVLDPDVCHVFSSCSALVLGDKYTNFIFEAPYDYHLLAKAMYFIEKNFVDKNTTMLRTTIKYEYEMKEYNLRPSLSFEVNDENLCIQYLRNEANGNMKFIVRTAFCYKELDYDQLEKEFADAKQNTDTNNVVETESDNNSKESVSLIYVPLEDGSFVKAPFVGNNMSFNEINERLGVRPGLYYVWFTNDCNTNICFKAFSKDIISIISYKDLGDSLTAKSVNAMMQKDGYDYDRAFDVYSREQLLEKGVTCKFLSQSFMEEVTHKNCIGNVLIDEENGYTYIFENGLLKAYASNDGLVGQAKEMKGSELFNIVKANAQKIYDNEQEVTKELNAQFKAYSNIPMDQLPIVAGYSYNYCQYYLENCQPNISLEDFLEYTHNKAEYVGETDTVKSYNYNSKIYKFNQSGNIVYGVTLKSGRKAHLMANKDVETDLDVIYPKVAKDNLYAVSLEIEAEDSAYRIAINHCNSKSNGEKSKYFTLTTIGTKIIARDAYTKEYYFTTQSESLMKLLSSGKQYLGVVTDVDLLDMKNPIFEISFMEFG